MKRLFLLIFLSFSLLIASFDLSNAGDKCAAESDPVYSSEACYITNNAGKPLCGSYNYLCTTNSTVLCKKPNGCICGPFPSTEIEVSSCSSAEDKCDVGSDPAHSSYACYKVNVNNDKPICNSANMCTSNSAVLCRKPNGCPCGSSDIYTSKCITELEVVVQNEAPAEVPVEEEVNECPDGNCDIVVEEVENEKAGTATITGCIPEDGPFCSEISDNIFDLFGINGNSYLALHMENVEMQGEFAKYDELPADMPVEGLVCDFIIGKNLNELKESQGDESLVEIPNEEIIQKISESFESGVPSWDTLQDIEENLALFACGIFKDGENPEFFTASGSMSNIESNANLRFELSLDLYSVDVESGIVSADSSAYINVTLEITNEGNLMTEEEAQAVFGVDEQEVPEEADGNGGEDAENNSAEESTPLLSCSLSQELSNSENNLILYSFFAIVAVIGLFFLQIRKRSIYKRVDSK